MLTTNNEGVETTAAKSSPSHYAATKAPNDSDALIPVPSTGGVRSRGSERETNNERVQTRAAKSSPSCCAATKRQTIVIPSSLFLRRRAYVVAGANVRPPKATTIHTRDAKPSHISTIKRRRPSFGFRIRRPILYSVWWRESLELINRILRSFKIRPQLPYHMTLQLMSIKKRENGNGKKKAEFARWQKQA